MSLVGIVLLVIDRRMMRRRVVTRRVGMRRRWRLRWRRRGSLSPRAPRDHGVEDALDEDAGVVLLEHLVPHLLVGQHGRHNLYPRPLELEPHVRQLLAVGPHRPGDDLDVGGVDLEGVVRIHVRDEQGEGAVKIEEEGPQLLADDDPVLAKLLGDPVDDRVLDDLPQVDVRLVGPVQR